MEENKNTGMNEQGNNEVRTFTQEDVDRIVTERLKRERMATADYEDLKAKAQKFDEMEEANKSELQKATDKAAALQAELDGMKKAAKIQAMRESVATETGVPVSLLTGSTEDECKDQAKAIAAFAKGGAYPSVPDSGEVDPNKAKQTTKQQFAEWFTKNWG